MTPPPLFTYRILEDLLDWVEECCDVLPALRGVEAGQQAQALYHPPQQGLQQMNPQVTTRPNKKPSRHRIIYTGTGVTEPEPRCWVSSSSSWTIIGMPLLLKQLSRNQSRPITAPIRITDQKRISRLDSQHLSEILRIQNYLRCKYIHEMET